MVNGDKIMIRMVSGYGDNVFRAHHSCHLCRARQPPSWAQVRIGQASSSHNQLGCWVLYLIYLSSLMCNSICLLLHKVFLDMYK